MKCLEQFLMTVPQRELKRLWVIFFKSVGREPRLKTMSIRVFKTRCGQKTRRKFIKLPTRRGQNADSGDHFGRIGFLCGMCQLLPRRTWMYGGYLWNLCLCCSPLDRNASNVWLFETCVCPPHPLYLLNLAPCQFLFCRMSWQLWRPYFEDILDI